MNKKFYLLTFFKLSKNKIMLNVNFMVFIIKIHQLQSIKMYIINFLDIFIK